MSAKLSGSGGFFCGRFLIICPISIPAIQAYISVILFYLFIFILG
jgi:hypothetical protein